MPEEEEVGDKTVEYTGYFDFGRLYQLLFDLFSSRDYEIYEKLYMKDEVDGIVRIKWDCFKAIDNYTKYDFSMEIMYVGYGEGEVQRGGRRMKMEKGDIEINLTATLVTDYKGAWKENFILSNLKGFYERYIYQGTLDAFSDELEDDLWDMVAELKSYFNI